MKLYATIESERASKGQGGNDYINIELQSGSAKSSFVEYAIEYTAEGIRVTDGDGSILLETGDREKGERQKGELCNCGYNPGFHEKQNDCR